jgi:ABC-type nitrate/sulfonate/bicarbonate transport system substrate-binding protein
MALYGERIAKSVLDIEAGEGPELFREYAYNAVFARQSFLREHADLAHRLVAAIVEAETVINDPTRKADILKVIEANMRGIDPEILWGLVERYGAIWSPIATPKAIENVNKLLLAGKVIPAAVSYEQLVASDFMPRSFAPKATQ